MTAAPQLLILSRPTLGEGLDAFLAAEGTAWQRSPSATIGEELAEFSGRICYMSFGANQSPRSNKEYIANLIANGHESVLEHVSWTFLLQGVSRAFTHQLVRHRPGFAYSQLSQQYHDETDADFVEPHGLKQYPAIFERWSQAIHTAATSYRAILNELETETCKSTPDISKKELTRAIRSAARSVLPNATETKIVVTANARALRHFLEVRGGIVGDFEMRAVSKLLYEMVRSEAPSFIADFECHTLQDGSPSIRRR
jgi:thymidylate synthase (FAD)